MISTDAWTPDVVEVRQKDLMDKFIAEWDLKEDDTATENPDFMIAGRGGDAVGHPLDDDSFVVCKGSRISIDNTTGIQHDYLNLRNQLVQDGVIQNNQFVKDYEFNSPSAAAAVVLGRSANGRREWPKLDGKTVAQAGH